MKINHQNIYFSNKKNNLVTFKATPCEILRALQTNKTPNLFPSRVRFIENVVRFFEDIETEAEILGISPEKPLNIKLGELNLNIPKALAQISAKMDIVKNNKLIKNENVTLIQADEYINSGSFLTDPTKESVKYLAHLTRGDLIKQLLHEAKLKNADTIDLFV